MTPTTNHQPPTDVNRAGRFIPATLAAALALAAMATTPAHAITYTAVIDQITSNFNGTSSTLILTPSVLPTLSGDFSADKTFVLRLEPPAGQKFNVAISTDLPDSRFLSFAFESGPGFTNTGDNVTSSVVFENLMGSSPIAPTSSDFRHSSTNPDFGVGSFAQLTGDFSFTALVATFAVPTTYNEVLNNQAPDRVFWDFSAEGDDLVPDPGQWVTFMDVAPPPPPADGVPEPITATLGLLSLAALGYTTQRRRA